MLTERGSPEQLDEHLLSFSFWQRIELIHQRSRGFGHPNSFAPGSLGLKVCCFRRANK